MADVVNILVGLKFHKLFHPTHFLLKLRSAKISGHDSAIHSHKVKWSGCDTEIHWECMAEETVGKGGG